MNNRPRIYAIVGTLLFYAIVLIWLVCSRLALPDKGEKWPPEHKSEIVLDEEFVTMADLPLSSATVFDEIAAAHLDESSDADSKPAPETGTDPVDNGAAGDPQPVVTTDRESSAKVQEKPQPEKPGPAVDKKDSEEEKVKRQTNNQVSNAFGKANGKHNADNGTGDAGNAGRPDSKASQGSLTGRGTGQAGGGWKIPAYGSVASPVTGSVVMMLKIDRTGKVTSVAFQGGEAPAATNSKVKEACKAEVYSRRFTRANPDDAPDESTAYITYTFR